MHLAQRVVARNQWKAWPTVIASTMRPRGELLGAAPRMSMPGTAFARTARISSPGSTATTSARCDELPRQLAGACAEVEHTAEL